jgi:hypothetical protein
MIAQDVPSISDDLDDRRLEVLEENCRLLASFAVSAAEAAYRGNRPLLGAHLDQCRLELAAAFRTLETLGGDADADQ